MEPIPDYMVGVSTPQISEHVVYPLYVQLYGGGCCREATKLFLREVPGVLIVSWASTHSLVCHYVTVSSTTHSLTLFLEVHQCRAIDFPKGGQHDLPSGSLCLEFFVGQRQQVLPLHRLSLTLWFIMVNPGLVSCHNSMEKSISFMSMMVQMLLTNCLLCTLVIIG